MGAKLGKVLFPSLTRARNGSVYLEKRGAYDYFEDFIYELKDVVDVEMAIRDVEKIGEEAFRVQYSIEERRTHLSIINSVIGKDEGFRGSWFHS